MRVLKTSELAAVSGAGWSLINLNLNLNLFSIFFKKKTTVNQDGGNGGNPV